MNEDRYRFNVEGAFNCFPDEDGVWMLYGNHLKVMHTAIQKMNDEITDLEKLNAIITKDRDDKVKEISSLKAELGAAYHNCNEKSVQIEALENGGSMIPADSTGGGGGGIE